MSTPSENWEFGRWWESSLQNASMSNFYDGPVCSVSHGLMVKYMTIHEYIGIINIPGKVFE